MTTILAGQSLLQALLDAAPVKPDLRSIPAWAGETGQSARRRPAQWVYPRVGGGNDRKPPPPLYISGLSPRGRGKHLVGVKESRYQRSIPAWAGETLLQSRQRQPIRVYPRVGGGNRQVMAKTPTEKGLSPRGRGKPLLPPRRNPQLGSIPAWAGETCAIWKTWKSAGVYPRVGGGNLRYLENLEIGRGLSPRGRGKPGFDGGANRRRRSIPAWAGETGVVSAGTMSLTVYPRVGGGNPNAVGLAGKEGGLSPRGRGKPDYRYR